MAANNALQLEKLEATLDEYLVRKAPFQLPPGAKDFIVKIVPWVAILKLLLYVGVLLPLLGLGALLAPVSFLGGVSNGVNYGWFFIVAAVEAAVVIVLTGMALAGLFHQQKRSWRLIYYAALVGIVANLLTLNLVGVVVGGLISLYFLFQIKSYYK